MVAQAMPARANMAFMSSAAGLSVPSGTPATPKATVSITTPASMVFFRPIFPAMKPTGR